MAAPVKILHKRTYPFSLELVDTDGPDPLSAQLNAYVVPVGSIVEIEISGSYMAAGNASEWKQVRKKFLGFRNSTGAGGTDGGMINPSGTGEIDAGNSSGINVAFAASLNAGNGALSVTVESTEEAGSHYIVGSVSIEVWSAAITASLGGG